jgi:nitrogen fixation NifU-like protein
MEDQLYRETLLEVVKNPPNRGEIKKADLEAKMVNPLCGDEVKIQIKLRGGRTIEKAAFSGNGCAISQASASLLAKKIEGENLAEVNKLSSDDILKIVGINPNPARLKCAVLSLDVLKEAINKVKS